MVLHKKYLNPQHPLLSIQLTGSVPDPWHFCTDPDPRIPTVPLTKGSGSCSFLQWPSRRQQNIIFSLVIFKGTFTSFFKWPKNSSRILIKEFKYFKPKKWFLSSRKYDLGCWSRIQGSKRHRIPDDPDPQHYKNLWIRNNAHRSEGGYDPVVGACALTAGRRGTGSPPPQARLAPAGPSRAVPQGCSAGSCSQGWKKPRLF